MNHREDDGPSSQIRAGHVRGSNDWFIDPSQGRFDLRVNGGATPVAKIDSSGGVTSSSQTLTGTGTAPFDLTSSSGVHILSGKLKLEPGAWIEYADGSVSTSSSAANASTVVTAGSVEFSVSTTWTPPAGVQNVQVVLVGGGGAGGGEIVYMSAFPVSGTMTVTISTGANASPSASGLNGDNANDSSFGTLIAHGGKGGQASPACAGGPGGAGGGSQGGGGGAANSVGTAGARLSSSLRPERKP